MRALTVLYLYNNNIGAEGARALAQSEHLPALTVLHLGGNHIGAEGKALLAQSPTLRHCQVST